jgi:hypothetical protein
MRVAMNKLIIGAMAMAVVACVGCQSSELAGTQWNVLEYYGPEADAVPDLKKMVVDFRRNGKLVTTCTFEDGRVTVEDGERYKVDEEHKVITIVDAKDKEMVSMYRFEGDNLRAFSEQFIVVMEPLKKSE